MHYYNPLVEWHKYHCRQLAYEKSYVPLETGATGSMQPDMNVKPSNVMTKCALKNQDKWEEAAFHLQVNPKVRICSGQEPDYST